LIASLMSSWLGTLFDSIDPTRGLSIGSNAAASPPVELIGRVEATGMVSGAVLEADSVRRHIFGINRSMPEHPIPSV